MKVRIVRMSAVRGWQNNSPIPPGWVLPREIYQAGGRKESPYCVGVAVLSAVRF